MSDWLETYAKRPTMLVSKIVEQVQDRCGQKLDHLSFLFFSVKITIRLDGKSDTAECKATGNMWVYGVDPIPTDKAFRARLENAYDSIISHVVWVEVFRVLARPHRQFTHDSIPSWDEPVECPITRWVQVKQKMGFPVNIHLAGYLNLHEKKVGIQ